MAHLQSHRIASRLPVGFLPKDSSSQFDIFGYQHIQRSLKFSLLCKSPESPK